MRPTTCGSCVTPGAPEYPAQPSVLARRWCSEPSGVARLRLGRYGLGMPFKHNAARRHRIPKTRYRVQNWPAYEAGLKRRGDLTLWLDEAALAKWQAPRR